MRQGVRTICLLFVCFFDIFVRRIRTKCMFVCKVVLGVGFEVTGPMQLTGPPAGYDSVLGKINDDEAIVYSEDAIIPRFIIVYKV